MFNRITLLIILPTLLITGCGKEDNRVTKKEDKQVNGQNPDSYFGQFVDEPTTEPTTSTVWHKALLTVLPRPLTADSGKINAEVVLFLLKTGDYSLKYSESVPSPGQAGVSSITFEQSYSGKWRVEGLDLVIDSIGRGSALKYNEKDAVSLTFDQDLHTPGLAKGALILQPGSTTGAP